MKTAMNKLINACD